MSSVVGAAAQSTPTGGTGETRYEPREALFGYGMISISLVVIVVFTLLPIVASFVLSLFSWDVISPAQFVGLANYGQIIHDPAVYTGFRVTLELAVLIVVAQLAVGMLLALILQEYKAKWFRAIFRTAYFLPLLASAASVSIVFSYLFDEKFGVINYYLSFLHIPGVAWLSSTAGATAAIVIVAVWQQLGFVFILFTAALGSMPQDVIEASMIDGSRALRQLWSIKLPLISPTIFFAAVIGFINAMQLFDQPYVLTQGGPGTATTTIVLLVYRTAFQNLGFGSGSAISVILFVILLAVTGIQFVGARRWVFYG